MPITETKKTQFHPTTRNKVLAAADVNIQQVQLVDKRGQVRSVVIWRCGTDMFYANTMDGMFDAAQRKTAPAWLVDAIKDLDADKQFNFDGTPKSSASAEKSYLPESDDDAPDFVQG